MQNKKTKNEQTRHAGNALPFLEKLNGGPLTFGQLINTMRLNEELSLEAMGEKLGVSASDLALIEDGQQVVSADVARQFARALNKNEEHFVKISSR